MHRAIRITAVLAAISWAGFAQAAPICGAAYANNVMPSTGCELGSTNNDKLNPLQVNVDQMFGFNDWEFAQKDDGLNGTDETAIDVGFEVLGDLIGGEWSLDNDIWAAYENVMIVIKGGNGNNMVATYVGYLIEFGEVVGSYITPFANANNGNAKDISHISVYVRGAPNVSVPEPGTLALLGLGLAGLGFARRRKTA